MKTKKFKFTGSMLKAMQACASTDTRKHTINAVHIKGCHMLATNSFVWVDVQFNNVFYSNEHFQLDRVRVDGISAKLKFSLNEMKDFMGQEPGRFPQQDIYEDYSCHRELTDQERGTAVNPKFLIDVAKVFKVFDVPMQIGIRCNTSIPSDIHRNRNVILATGKNDNIKINAVIACTITR